MVEYNLKKETEGMLSVSNSYTFFEKNPFCTENEAQNSQKELRIIPKLK